MKGSLVPSPQLVWENHHSLKFLLCPPWWEMSDTLVLIIPLLSLFHVFVLVLHVLVVYEWNFTRFSFSPLWLVFSFNIGSEMCPNYCM